MTDNVLMRLLHLRPHTPPAETTLPEAASVYEAALRMLVDSHESEAAAFLARCQLEILPTGGAHMPHEHLTPVRLVITGPGEVVAELEQNAEIHGRIRQALDRALGSTFYLTQLAVSARSSVLAA